MEKSRRDYLIFKWIVFPGMYGIGFIVANIVGQGCIWKYLFGVNCPGCGMTRAWFSVSRLDFTGAFGYNPMFWSLPVLVYFYIKDGNVFKTKIINTILILGILFGLFAVWIYRLVNGIVI